MVVTPPRQLTTKVTGINAPVSSSRMSCAGLSITAVHVPRLDSLLVDDARSDQVVDPQRVVAIVVCW